MLRGLMVTAWVSLALPAFADGMLAPAKGLARVFQQELQPTTPRQSAAIIRRPDGRESLILQPTYRGPAADFAWVVPVPAQVRGEDVIIAPGRFVERLLWYTQPQVETIIHSPKQKGRGWKGPPPPAGMGAPGPGGTIAPPPVTVHEEVNVGAYHAAILSATGGRVLQEWLDRNGYRVPDGADQVLQTYVSRNWFFVAFKLRAGMKPDQIRAFDLSPLCLTFPTDRLVYPLTITRLSAPARLSLLLVVIDREPVREARLATVWPESQVELPMGSVYGTYRRQVAQQHLEGALLREAVVRTQDLPRLDVARRDPLSDMPLDEQKDWEWGYIKSGRTSGYASRFFAWLDTTKMEDLVFVPDPGARPYVTKVVYESWPPVPAWVRVGQARVLWPLLCVAALLLIVYLNWRAGREHPDERPPLPLLPITVWAIPALTVLLAYLGEVQLSRSGLRGFALSVLRVPSYQPTTAADERLALHVHVGLLALALLAAGLLWRALPRSERTPLGAWGLAVAVVATMFQWGPYLAGEPLRGLFLPAFFLATLWVGVTAGSLVLLVALLARHRLGRVRALHVAGQLFAAALVVLALSVAARLGSAYGYEDPEGTYAGRIVALQRSLTDFARSFGAYPASPEQLLQPRPTQGQDAGGNPARLPEPPAPFADLRSPAAAEMLVDPLTGRSDTWVVDPLTPEIINSGGFVVRVSSAPIEVRP